MTATRRRALGLRRVSKEGGRGDDLLSPEIQSAAIVGLCEQRGYTLVDTWDGIDQSGSQARSAWWPTLDRACAAVEAGEYDVIVLRAFDRVSRNRLRWATAIDRVDCAGGLIESATEQIDVTTAAGRFTRGMFGELAAFKAEMIGEGWKEVHANRVGRGLTHNGRPRFGYTYIKKIGYVPHPEHAAVLADAYGRFIGGQGFYSIARWLNANGLRTTTGGLWRDDAVRRVLDSGFGAGWFTYHGESRQGAHEPVIAPEVWETYLAARAERRRVPARRKSSPYLLSGLIRCGWCEGRMNGGTFGKGRTPKYRCERRRGTAGAGCQRGGYVSVARVHDQVMDEVRARASGVDAEAAEYAAEREASRRTTAGDVDRLAREVTRLQTSLTKLVTAWTEGEVDDAAYRQVRADYERRRDDARQAYEHAAQTARRLDADPAGVAQTLLEDWDTLAVASRRELLRDLFAEVKVWTYGRGTPPVVEVVPLA